MIRSWDLREDGARKKKENNSRYYEITEITKTTKKKKQERIAELLRESLDGSVSSFSHFCCLILWQFFFLPFFREVGNLTSRGRVLDDVLFCYILFSSVLVSPRLEANQG